MAHSQSSSPEAEMEVTSLVIGLIGDGQMPAWSERSLEDLLLQRWGLLCFLL